MRAVCFTLRIASCLGLLLGAWQSSVGAESLGGNAERETAIRQAAAAYVKALHARDADALAALWTADGTIVSSAGDLTNARAMIKELAGPSSASSEQDLEGYSCESKIRFLATDAAIEEGHCAAQGGGVNFVAIWVHRDGKWLLDHLSEHRRETETARPLDGLAWMIGTWVGEGEGLTITCRTRWSENKSFLVRRLVFEGPGADPMTATQRIGWDPSTETIRSWTFNSDGSVIKGRWLPMDGAWMVQNTGVLADKGRFSSVNFWIPEGEAHCVLKTSHVERDDVAAADSMIEFRRVSRTAGGDQP